MQLLMYKWNYDSQINIASAVTFSMITAVTDWVNVVKHSAKQLGGSQVTRAQSGLN